MVDKIEVPLMNTECSLNEDEKYEFIDTFNKKLNNSRIFSQNGMNLCYAFKYFFDKEKNIDEIFSEMHCKIERVTKYLNRQVDLEKEKYILNEVLNLTQNNISKIKTSWFSESEKNKAKGYIAIMPYKNSELFIIFVFSLLYLAL